MARREVFGLQAAKVARFERETEGARGDLLAGRPFLFAFWYDLNILCPDQDLDITSTLSLVSKGSPTSLPEQKEAPPARLVSDETASEAAP